MIKHIPSMMMVVQILAYSSAISVALSAGYTAHGIFERFDRIEAATKSAEKVTIKLEELLDAARVKLPATLDEGSKKVFDNLQDAVERLEK